MPDSATDERPQGVSRRSFMTAAVGSAVAAGAVAAGVLTARPREAKEFVSHYRPGQIPAADPEAGEWGDLRPFRVPLRVQNIAPPVNEVLAVEFLLVRSLNNGNDIAFHVEWHDPQPSEIEAQARFRDAVAIQMPVNPGDPPSVTMGQPKSPVHILQWKASWQADIDEGQKTVNDAFPNAFNDVFPEAIMGEDAARVFYPGLNVGNPLSSRDKKTPVEELVAEGFGSLTTQADQRAVGKGVFSGRRWRVAVGIPMRGGDGRASLDRAEVPVAFAVWNGDERQRGGRKQWGDWTTLAVRGAQP